MSADYLPLWPPVRELEFLPGQLSVAQAPQCIRDPQLPAEGYMVHAADGQRPRLIAADAAAERHGLATWTQLQALHQDRGSLPALRIVDQPAYPIRGVMLDISRCRVPTMDQLRSLIRDMAALKANHLQLYIEHSLAYVGHETAWAGASALSVDELRELGLYAQSWGIECCANQNTFGHCERYLQHPAYAALGEFTDVQQRLQRGEPGPFSLCPVDPRCRSMARDWLNQQMAVLPAPWVHIGCDETQDVGQGRSAVAAAQRGTAALWTDYTAAMCHHVIAAGRRPLVWADMALEHPQSLRALPPEAVAVAWHYEADAPFSRWAEAFAAAGRAWWVAPGTSAWRSWLGRGDARSGSIAAAAEQGLAAGASGFLVTEWGDLGHRQPWPVSWYGLAEGLGAAWNAAAAARPDHSALGRWALHCPALGPWLDACSRHDITARAQASHPLRGGPLINASMAFIDSCLPWQKGDWSAAPQPWQTMRETLRSCAMPSAAATSPYADELAHGQQVVDVALWRALARRGACPSRGLASAWLEVAAIHREQWLQRCRHGGLAESCHYYERLAAEPTA